MPPGRERPRHWRSAGRNPTRPPNPKRPPRPGPPRPRRPAPPPAPTGSGADPPPRGGTPPASAVSTSITGGGGTAGASLGAPDAGELLSRSPSSVGVDIQKRNAVVNDPRIRGLRAGQYLTYG